jgi:hypothetical protein
MASCSLFENAPSDSYPDLTYSTLHGCYGKRDPFAPSKCEVQCYDSIGFSYELRIDSDSFNNRYNYGKDSVYVEQLSTYKISDGNTIVTEYKMEHYPKGSDPHEGSYSVTAYLEMDTLRVLNMIGYDRYPKVPSNFCGNRFMIFKSPAGWSL